MKKIFQALGYTAFGGMLVAVDFLSKQWALVALKKPMMLNPWCSLELLLNRGISWGMFHHADQPFFIALSVAISIAVVMLFGYTVFRFLKGHEIYAETLVLSGAVGNLIDRSLYQGVVDFVIFHIGPFSTPVFNIADAFIVIGVICILTISSHD